VNQLLSTYPAEIQAILAKYPPDRKRSAVMPLLYLAQRTDNYISHKDLEDIAEIIGVSVTDVASIVGFYTLYHDQPGGRYRIQVCTDLPCALRGAETFLQVLCGELGIGVGETTPDGLFTIEPVTCLAACHRAPMFQVQGDGDIVYHENQTAETALKVLQALRDKVTAETQRNQEAA
jgi:NADH-quinone oxidoreductase E subunit